MNDITAYMIIVVSAILAIIIPLFDIKYMRKCFMVRRDRIKRRYNRVKK